MLRRFFSATPIGSDMVTLTESEAHHLIHVIRAQPGDTVELFDGSGGAFVAEVMRLSRKTVELRIVSRHCSERELPAALTLAVALPRGDRLDWLLQKAVEIGVTRLVPWTTERGVVRATARTQQRMQRGVIEASKQCRRDRLMEVAAPIDFATFLSETVGTTAGAMACLAHLTEPPPPPLFHELQRRLPSTPDTIIGIGPEGGFTDEEAALAARHGWHLVGLGRTVLRAETAAIAAAALVALTSP